MSAIIRVDNISKCYNRADYQPSLRHEGQQLFKRLLGQPTDLYGDPFWALRDIHFEVHQGEAVAIVGRNGSGKTTLLRILSGITEPTTGSTRVEGRFASLIGLSAGFDHQRTGRQNVFFNAAVYGLRPHEVEAIFDDIIAFSELEAFIDVPVKRYSSGMIARLGFSIAIHILPDIIFLDEVLSVGDAAFQEKCAARIADLKARRCTILFVSHSPTAVRELCERAIWLHHGALMADGPTDAVLEAYHAATSGDSGHGD